MKTARGSAPIFSIRLESDPGFQPKDAAPAHMWAWLVSAILLGAVFVMSAVFYVWLYAQQIQNGYRLSKMYKQIELLSTVQRKLTVEWARFQDPQWLGEIGRDQFGMAPPGPDQKVMMR